MADGQTPLWRAQFRDESFDLPGGPVGLLLHVTPRDWDLGSVRLWDRAAGGLRLLPPAFGRRDSCQPLRLAPGGRHLFRSHTHYGSPATPGERYGVLRYDLPTGAVDWMGYEPDTTKELFYYRWAPAPDGSAIAVAEPDPASRPLHPEYRGQDPHALLRVGVEGLAPERVATIRTPSGGDDTDAVSWSPDGGRLAIGGCADVVPHDVTGDPVSVLIHDAETGAQVDRVMGVGPQGTAPWSWDSRRVLLKNDAEEFACDPGRGFGFYDLDEREVHWFDDALLESVRLNPRKPPVLLGFAGDEHLLWHTQKGRTTVVHYLHLPSGRQGVVLRFSGVNAYTYVKLTPMPGDWWDLPVGPPVGVDPVPVEAPDPTAPGGVAAEFGMDEPAAMALLQDPDAWHRTVQAVADAAAGPDGPRVTVAPWTLRQRTSRPGTCLTDPTLTVEGLPDEAVRRALSAAAVRFALVDAFGTEHADMADADDGETFTPGDVSSVTSKAGRHAVRVDLDGADYPLLSLGLVRALVDELRRAGVTEATLGSEG